MRGGPRPCIIVARRVASTPTPRVSDMQMNSSFRAVVTTAAAALLAVPSRPGAAQQPSTTDKVREPVAHLVKPSAGTPADSAVVPDSGAGPARRIALTVSGGVSLGSYQAGATWALVHVLRNQDTLRSLGASVLRARRLPRYTLDVLTGASAGNVNAILAAVDYCAARRVPNPAQTEFWRSWVNMGYPELTTDVGSGDTAVFNRIAFGRAWDRLKWTMDSTDARPDGCDLVLGITATKLTPDRVVVRQGLDAPSQRYAAVFRLVDSASHRLAFASPRADHLDDQFLTDVILLDPDRDAEDRPRPLRTGSRSFLIRDTTVRALLEASSSFPVAFEPRMVNYRTHQELREAQDTVPGAPLPPCMGRLTPRPQPCDPPRRQRFVDGGFFDNRPLGLAFSLGSAREASELRDSTNARLFESALEAVRDAEKGCGGKASGAAAMIAALLGSRDTTRTWEQLSAAEVRQKADRWRQVSERLDSLANSPDSDVPPAFTICVKMLQSRVRKAVVALPTESRLLYYIDDETRRAAGRIETAPREEARGGLGAAMQLAVQGLQTGQNNEMRSFATRLRIASDNRDSLRLGLNSRFAPLMGEHLLHFGAFFAHTFREHDFYVGVYDGLRSAFRELYCADTARVEAMPKGRGPCEVQWLDIVLHNGLVTLDPAGQAVVARLLEREEGDGASLRTDGPHPDHRARSLLALLEANRTERSARPGTRCRTSSITERPLCTERLLPIIDAWRSRLDVVEGGWDDVLCADTTGATYETDCRLVRDARATYNGEMMNVLRRLHRTEEWLDLARGTPGYPTPTGFLLYVVRTKNEEFRSCWQVRELSCLDLNTTTADVLDSRTLSVASRLLPHSFLYGLDGDRQSIGWRPTAYLWRWNAQNLSFAAVAPLEVDWRWEHGRSPAWANAGVGVHLIPLGRVPLLSGLTVTRLSTWRTGSWEPAAPMLDVTTSWLGGTVRLGYRAETGPLKVSWARTMIGVGDVNGLSTRIIRFFWNLRPTRRPEPTKPVAM
jgi:predicted acylesterase/phospholipase RssA